MTEFFDTQDDFTIKKGQNHVLFLEQPNEDGSPGVWFSAVGDYYNLVNVIVSSLIVQDVKVTRLLTDALMIVLLEKEKMAKGN